MNGKFVAFFDVIKSFTFLAEDWEALEAILIHIWNQMKKEIQ